MDIVFGKILGQEFFFSKLFLILCRGISRFMWVT